MTKKNTFSKAFNGIYSGKRVLVTGHTGFKGSWLCLWLANLGAEVLGYSLEPSTDPNHISLIKLDMESVIGDIRNAESLLKVFGRFKPEMVFHLAAQPLVRLSYKDPVTTFDTNIMGTINALEACRMTESVRSIVIITSDKCYENREWIWGYRENDSMGGYDPYSASKGCAELVTSSYRNSFFNVNEYEKNHQVLLSSVRAGNVIGGGDWAEDRLIPDIMKAANEGRDVMIRNPNATRPWQHVLDPLSGYLLLGSKLIEKKKEFAEAWNFGPSDEGSIPVGDVVQSCKTYWDKIRFTIQRAHGEPHEARLLKLDCSKAHIILQWKSIWDCETAFEKTTHWYREFYEHGKVRSHQDLGEYLNDAMLQHAVWSEA